MNTLKLCTRAGVTAGILLWGLVQGYGQGIYGPVPTIDYNYPHYANSPLLRKFVDKLPGLTPAGANGLGQYIPLAVRGDWVDLNGVAHTDQDYYEIALVEYREQMHSDLPPVVYDPAYPGNKTKARSGGTRLRGYVQLSTSAVPGARVPLFYPDGTRIMVNGVQATAVDNPHYLGPLILATKDRPVRVKFCNLLPGGAAGNLFLPVDTSVAGAGPYEIDDPNNPGQTIQGAFTQNRATLHLHGGLPGWESDGTVHQWITPANDPWAANYPKGQSVKDVPDMGIQQNGSQTFFWPNQQSGRLLFYHDHAWGMTAANVYVGEAAGYLIVDPAGEEDRLAALGVPGTVGTQGADLAHLVPLVIQDKTWVWGVNNNTVNPDGTVTVGPLSTGTWSVDPMWAKHAPTSQPGDLWTPHIYVPIQDPFASEGLNPFGRWHYGPWFWPIFPTQLPLPENSHCPESFQDTATINGTPFPYLEVQPTKYRFRILNAAADRFLNLQLYEATKGIVSSLTIDNPGSGYLAPVVTITRRAGDTTGRGAVATATADPVTGAIVDLQMDIVGSDYTLPPIVTIEDAFGGGTGARATANLYTLPTEVGMVPFVNPVAAWPENYGTPDNRLGGVPDPRKRGPAFIQIGTEGGILPNAVLMKNKPINFDWNKGSATFGNVKEHGVYLGSAERADMIVDFSKFAGRTLILYNDAPAPVPANASYYDYYTCAPDNTPSGGAPPTLPGKGPNTRTLMQIRVAGTPSATTPPANDYSSTLLSQLQSSAAGVPAIYRTVQEAPVVPQPPYVPAFGALPPGGEQNWYSRVSNNIMTFIPFGSADPVTMFLHPKAIAEEMDFVYARMNATLGVELPFTGAFIQTTLWYGLIDPPTEIFNDNEVQIWKLTHNGVDTHAIHFHIVNVQIVNRVGWDNAVKPPDPEELGWKDTIKINPLEDIIFATRAKTPNLPFKVGHSKRLHNPEQPTGSLVGFMNTDPLTGNGITVSNVLADFGWEYVWHCHLLGHEEYDMMRPFVVNVAPDAPSTLAAALAGSYVDLSWVNPTPAPTGDLAAQRNATSLLLQRRVVPGGPWVTVAAALAPTATAFQDTTAAADTTYEYQLRTENAKSFSDWITSNPVTTPAMPPPNAPNNLRLTASTVGVAPITIRLQWVDRSNNEQGFEIQRSTDGGATWAVVATVGANVNSWTDSAILGNTRYTYQVRAWNAGGFSAFTTPASITSASNAVPAAPSNVRITQVQNNALTLGWNDNSNNETVFQIQRSSTANGPWTTVGVASANATSFRNGGLARRTTYYYQVRASNSFGQSAWVPVTPVSGRTN